MGYEKALTHKNSDEDRSDEETEILCKRFDISSYILYAIDICSYVDSEPSKNPDAGSAKHSTISNLCNIKETL